MTQGNFLGIVNNPSNTSVSGVWGLIDSYGAMKSGAWVGPTPSIVTSGLVMNLDAGNSASYPGSGTTWTDLSGLGTNGTLTNGPTFNSSNSGSIVLDGSNDYVAFDYDLRTNWSYECWVLKNVSTSFAFLGLGPTGVTSSAISIALGNPNSTTLRFGFWANDTDFPIATTLTNTWYHYCFTYNHSSPFTKKCYRNGVEISGTPVQTQAQFIGTGTVRIGATYGPSVNDAYANGRFAISRLYNRVLSQAEITQNFNALRGRYGI